jgi:hypothetical protein
MRPDIGCLGVGAEWQLAMPQCFYLADFCSEFAFLFFLIGSK